MRNIVFTLLPVAWFMATPFAHAQQSEPQKALNLLREARMAARSVQQADYTMRFDMKFMTSKDTMVRRYKTRLFPMPEDSLFGAWFRYEHFDKDGKHQASIAYNGQACYSAFRFDSSLQIDRIPEGTARIQSYAHNFPLYRIFRNPIDEPIPADSALASDTAEYLGMESLQGALCHHVRLRMKLKNEDHSADVMRVMRYTQEFWIDARNFFPVSFARTSTIAFQGDTMLQYQRFTLEEYSISSTAGNRYVDTLFDPVFQPKADKPDEDAPLPFLPWETEAPDFTLPGLDGKPVSLRQYRGKVVLLDFFYRSCYPCMLAIPGLQELHHQLQDSGLVVLGVNPFDTATATLQRFLSSRGVQYPVLIDADKEVVKTWMVRAYPTLYLIDRNGKIRFNQIGYSKETEGVVVEKVKALLREE
jgi:peroxiredoxin